MADLIFDIGLHNGDDTAYYLSRGYDVIAVDAHPGLCAEAKRRFSAEVAARRLDIQNVGIADQEGELTFWVSERSEWSSFDKLNATKGGMTASPTDVPVMRLSGLVNQYRRPLFIKIDIEGQDSASVHDLENCTLLPRYISFEGHPEAAQDIAVLAKLGYSNFKFIRQNDWHEITPENIHRYNRARRVFSSRPIRRYKLIRAGLRAIYYRRFWPKFRNPFGSSGPVAWELPGRWLDCSEILTLVREYDALSETLQSSLLGDWFDIVAAIPSVGS
jgi:FkbM family methyltransferase